MKTVRELIKEAESKLDDEHKDVNVAKVLFYHLAKKEPHELYLMMNEEVEPELEKAFLAWKNIIKENLFNILKGVKVSLVETLK